MRIKDISLYNRPVERLERQGPNVLSNAELLAIILKTGTKKENVVDMCNRLLSKYDNISKCSLKELQEIKGIGKVKASQIIAVFELNKRFSIKKNVNLIKSAKDVFNYYFPKISILDKEQFMVLHLDVKNRIIKDEVISVGTLNSSLIHPREVFKSAIKESANSIILVHNHPSGDPEPSEEDKTITEVLFNTGELLSIKVLDHVIIGNKKWYSFRENV